MSSGFNRELGAGDTPPQLVRMPSGQVSHGYPPPTPEYEPDDLLSIDLGAYARMLWRHKWFVALFAVAGATLGFLSILFLPDVYEARATIEAMGFNENFMGMAQIDPQAGIYSLTPVNLGTQVRILEGASLRRKAAERVEVQNLAVNIAPDASITALRVRVQESLGIRPTDPVTQTTQAVASASRSFRAAPIEGTRLMEVRCESSNPTIAADFINTLANIHIEDGLQERLKSGTRNVQWLANQAEEMKRRSEEAEARVQQNLKKIGASSLPQQETLAESRMRQLQLDLAQSQAERIGRQARYESARQSPEMIEDLSASQSQSALAAMRQELAGLQLRFTPEHPRVKEIQARIAETERMLRQARQAALDRLKGDFESAQDRERKLLSAYEGQSRAVSSQSSKLNEFNLLKREAEASRLLYQQMLQQVQQAAAVTGVPTPSLRVVEPAEAPGRPVSPNILLNTGLGGSVGILLGFVTAFVRWQVDTTIRVPADLSAALGVRQLAMVPSFESALAFERKSSLLSRLGVKFRRRENHLAKGKNGVVSRSVFVDNDTNFADQAPIVLSESFRNLIASLVTPEGDLSSPKVLTFTSPYPGEGKSTITANLAVALAETRWNVVILEADLRRPCLRNLLDLEQSVGLAELVQSARPFSEYAREELASPTAVPRLWAIPAGADLSNPVGILYSDRLRELVARLRKEFDFVLIDTPPILVVPDAHIVGQLSDGAVLVVGAGASDRTAVMEARQRLLANAIPCLGLVLNNFNWFAGSAKPKYQKYYAHYKAE